MKFLSTLLVLICAATANAQDSLMDRIGKLEQANSAVLDRLKSVETKIDATNAALATLSTKVDLLANPLQPPKKSVVPPGTPAAPAVNTGFHYETRQVCNGGTCSLVQVRVANAVCDAGCPMDGVTCTCANCPMNCNGAQTQRVQYWSDPNNFNTVYTASVAAGACASDGSSASDGVSGVPFMQRGPIRRFLSRRKAGGGRGG